MSEKKSARSDYVYNQKRAFHIELGEMPSLKSNRKKRIKSDFNEQELEAMCKNPRESAELIRYLIEFIKTL